jgi:site-specific DNA-adenine methylase
VTKLRAPFPWFGGKSKAAPAVWEALGNVDVYVEPFAGSLAVLLARPHAPRIETVNDLDCYLANFWRATAADPEAVIRAADWPVNEADLHARHEHIRASREETQRRMHAEHAYYDAELAGFWLWGVCTSANLANWLRDGVMGAGPNVSARPKPGVHRTGSAWQAELRALRDRLRNVRVLCGDWTRALTFSVLHGDRANPALAGVLLDPPYAHAERDADCYGANDSECSAAVRAWAVAHGEDERLRIVLCGYEGEHAMPASWRSVAWGTQGGWGNNGERGRRNKHRERLWLSPHCLRAVQGKLFAEAP